MEIPLIEAVLFDLDFTLCDASSGIDYCIRRALVRMGEDEPSAEAVRNSIGLSLPETYIFLTGKFDQERERTFEALFLEQVPGNLTSRTDIFTSVPTVLSFLRQHGVKTGLVTSKYREAVEELLEVKGLSTLFDCIVCGDDVVNTKPDPAGLKLCCERLEIKSYLYVGDSTVDFHAVRAHGIGDFLPVLSGTTTMENFNSIGVEFALPGVADVPSVVAKRLWSVKPQEYASLQQDVEQMILSVGGYWGAPSAVMRVIEELGEFSDALRRHDREAAAEELTDLFVITTCIANQYCAMLWERGEIFAGAAHAPVGVDPLQLIPLFVEMVGELARTINSYDGEKLPKPGERPEPVESLIAKMHSLIWQTSFLLHFDLRASLRHKLQKAAGRDRGRFTTKFDHSTSGSASTLRTIQAKTKCPFARRAKIWGAKEWDETADFEANVRAAADGFARFARISRLEGLDVFAITLPDSYGATVDDLASTTARLLNQLAVLDKGQSLQPHEVGNSEWQFTFGGEHLFVTTHAACYPSNHSRHHYGCGSTVFAFHPEHSFDSPRFNVNGQAIHSLVQALFREGGQPYEDSSAMHSELEAAKYVKPIDMDKPIVEWWAAPAQK